MSAAQPRQPSLIDIEVLPLADVREDAINYYIGLDPARASWDQAKRDRLAIRTECKWGRAQFEGADGQSAVYMLNENGEGPKTPLTKTNCAYVSLFAEMRKDGNDPGFFETTPFCKVPVNDETARQFKASGLVKLEEFIRVRGADMESMYESWRTTLSSSKERIQEVKAKRAAKAAAKQKGEALPTEVPAEGESMQEGESGPRARV